MKLLSFFRALYASEGNINDLLKLCAQFLNAERVSLWTVKEEILFCEHMYIKSTDEFMGGLLLRREKCLELLHTLEKEGVFLAQTPHSQTLKDCMGEYLSFVDTKVLAIVPLLEEAKLDGFIMCESQHERSWDAQDIGILLCASTHIRNLYEKQSISFMVNMYRTLSLVNQALIKAKSREEIFGEICRIAVEAAGFRMAWIGLLDDAGNIKPVSWYGHVENYLESISINIYSKKLNKGPSARAVLEKKVQVNNDTETEPSVLEWRTQMLKRGYLSSCAYPIRLKGKVIGTLNLYSDRKGAFTHEVVKLVEEIGEDLSFALEHIDLLKSMEMMYMATEQSFEWVMITDKSGNIMYVNPAVERISGYTKEELLGKNPRIFKSGLHSREFYKNLWDTILSGESFRAVFINRRKDKSLFYLDAIISPLRDETGNITAFVSTGSDITQVRQLEENLYRLVNYDALTDLPTRVYFLRELEETIKEKPHSNITVLLMDIHNLGSINAVYGYEFGDKVLRAFAQNLKILPAFCARYGDDEFVLFKEMKSAEDIYELLKSVFNACNLSIEGKSYKLGIHIGVSLYPIDGQRAQELVRNAEIALKKAKVSVPGSYEFYNPEEGEKVFQWVKMEQELRSALKREEFLIYFQPVYRTSDLKVAGAEELLRWNSRSMGFVQAKDFVPVLEKTGLILDVSDYVFKKCIQFIKEYNIKVPISINLSPAQLRQKDLAEKLCHVVKASGISPELLNVEITEEMLIEDLEGASRRISELKTCGFLITLDDFGVRYSSLSYLAKLPVDYIKIDMSFIKLIDQDEKTLKVVLAIINMAKSLKIKTVAEGVERKSQLEILKELGCDYVQGFYFSKPLPVEEFISILSIS